MKEEMYDIMYQTERDHWWYRVRRELVSRLLGQIQEKRSGTPLHILDVGCGTGLLMQEMQQFGQVEGVDMSERAVAYCRERGLNPVVGSADHLPFSDGSFDVVVMLDVLEHLEDDSAGAREVNRVLRPGGVAIIAAPAFMFLWGVTDEISRHYRRYTRGSLVRILKGAGLNVVRSTYFNTLLFLPIAAVRILVRVFRIPVKSENTMGGAWINKLLYRIFALEPLALRIMDFPFGVSILAIVSKK